MPPGIIDRLRRVERLSEDMLALADARDATGSDLECGILFGTLRDCAYKLRQLALNELAKRGGLEGAGP